MWADFVICCILQNFCSGWEGGPSLSQPEILLLSVRVGDLHTGDWSSLPNRLPATPVTLPTTIKRFRRLLDKCDFVWISRGSILLYSTGSYYFLK